MEPDFEPIGEDDLRAILERATRIGDEKLRALVCDLAQTALFYSGQAAAMDRVRKQNRVAVQAHYAALKTEAAGLGISVRELQRRRRKTPAP